MIRVRDLGPVSAVRSIKSLVGLAAAEGDPVLIETEIGLLASVADTGD